MVAVVGAPVADLDDGEALVAQRVEKAVRGHGWGHAASFGSFLWRFYPWGTERGARRLTVRAACEPIRTVAPGAPGERGNACHAQWVKIQSRSFV
ncbi:hypothetical protein GCM10010273_37240 [Streptomyces lavendulocolor]